MSEVLIWHSGHITFNMTRVITINYRQRTSGCYWLTPTICSLNIVVQHYNAAAKEFVLAGYLCDAESWGFSNWQAAALYWQAYNTQKPIFSITHIDTSTTETANHALRCRMLSRCLMAPSIPVIVDILRRGTHSLWAWGASACGPWRALWEGAHSGPCWDRPVDSSLALLSQQEDISWSNSEAVDEDCMVSGENVVGED